MEYRNPFLDVCTIPFRDKGLIRIFAVVRNAYAYTGLAHILPHGTFCRMAQAACIEYVIQKYPCFIPCHLTHQ
jgi:hypothetical protein